MSKIAQVDLISLYQQKPSDEYAAVLNGLCNQTCFIPWRNYGRWLRAGISLISGRTMTEGLFYSQRLKNQVRKWSQNNKYDYIVSFCSSMYQYTKVPELNNVPLITDIVDVDSQKWFDYAQVCTGLSGLFKKIIFQTEGRRLRNCEIEIAQQGVKTLVVSDDEAALYRSFCPVAIHDKIITLSNGVDADYFSPHGDFSSLPADNNRCVFVGALDYRANLDGIAWFIENVWSDLRRKYPAFELDLVGSNPGEKVRAFAKTPGINLIGRVDDVRAYINRSLMVIVPLRVARGIQNKVLEAMAMAKPVLASSMSLQGIENSVTQFAYCCSQPEEWVSQMKKIIDSPDEAKQQAILGRNAIVSSYSWNNRFAKLSEIILNR